MAIWDRQEGESAKAYEAFVEYLDLGKKRSQKKLAEKIGRGRKSWIAQWSADFQWVERAAAYDAEKLEKGLKNRRGERERGRNRLVEATDAAIGVIIDLAKDKNAPPSVRLGAARDILDRGGLVAPRRYEIEAAPGTDLEVKMRGEMKKLSTEQLLTIANALGNGDADS